MKEASAAPFVLLLHFHYNRNVRVRAIAPPPAAAFFVLLYYRTVVVVVGFFLERWWCGNDDVVIHLSPAFNDVDAGLFNSNSNGNNTINELP